MNHAIETGIARSALNVQELKEILVAMQFDFKLMQAGSRIKRFAM
jgi:hypothetical protein